VGTEECDEDGHKDETKEENGEKLHSCDSRKKKGRFVFKLMPADREI
jgi:hypothetical protein